MSGHRGLAAGDPDKAVPAGLFRRLSTNIGWLVVGTAAAAMFTMAALAFVARGLPMDQFGLLVLLQSAALTLRGILGVGTQQPIIHLGTVALKDDDKVRLGRLIGFGLALDIGTAILASAVGFALILLGGDLIGMAEEDRHYAYIFAFAVLFMGYLTSSGLFRLVNRFGLMTFIQTGTTALLCAATGFFWLAEAPFDYYIYAWAAYLALSAQAPLVAAVLLMRRQGVRTRIDIGQLSDEDRRLFRSYAWSTWGTIVVHTTRMYGDSLLLGAMLSVESVGIYNVAKQIAGILRKLTDNYAAAVFPEVARLARDQLVSASRRLLRRMLWIVGACGLIGTLGMALIGRPVLELAFGPAFVDGYGALLLLTAAAGLQLIGHTFAVYIQIYRSPGRLFWMYLAGLVCYIPAAVMGSHLLGITGAALGQVIFSVVIIVLAASATLRALREAEAV